MFMKCECIFSYQIEIMQNVRTIDAIVPRQRERNRVILFVDVDLFCKTGSVFVHVHVKPGTISL